MFLTFCSTYSSIWNIMENLSYCCRTACMKILDGGQLQLFPWWLAAMHALYRLTSNMANYNIVGPTDSDKPHHTKESHCVLLVSVNIYECE